MTSNNFDGVAFIYDFLVQLFFGRNLRKAQTHFLSNFPNDVLVLVLGSGTGWIAEEILKEKPDSKVTLIDASQRMTDRARKRLKGKSVDIFCANESKVFSIPFDVIVLPFFLDLFPDKKMNSIIEAIKKNTKPKSVWLVTDFVSERRWHRIYLWIMYRFFKWTCNIEADGLPDWHNALALNKILIQEKKSFYNGFIQSAVCIQK